MILNYTGEKYFLHNNEANSDLMYLYPEPTVLSSGRSAKALPTEGDQLITFYTKSLFSSAIPDKVPGVYLMVSDDLREDYPNRDDLISPFAPYKKLGVNFFKGFTVNDPNIKIDYTYAAIQRVSIDGMDRFKPLYLLPGAVDVHELKHDCPFVIPFNAMQALAQEFKGCLFLSYAHLHTIQDQRITKRIDNLFGAIK